MSKKRCMKRRHSEKAFSFFLKKNVKKSAVRQPWPALQRSLILVEPPYLATLTVSQRRRTACRPWRPSSPPAPTTAPTPPRRTTTAATTGPGLPELVGGKKCADAYLQSLRMPSCCFSLKGGEQNILRSAAKKKKKRKSTSSGGSHTHTHKKKRSGRNLVHLCGDEDLLVAARDAIGWEELRQVGTVLPLTS